MAKKSKNSIEKDKEEEQQQKSDILDAAMASIRKDCGVEIRDLSKAVLQNVEVIPTGILSVDRAVKAFGLPRGRIIELFGPHASGKSALALMTAAQVQRDGGVVAWFDLENAFDTTFANLLGVDVSKLLYVDDASAEDCIDAIIKLIETNVVDLVVVDSVSNMVPKEELDNDMGKIQVALQARVLSKGLRKLTAIVGRTRACVLFINQIRMKVGVMFGSPETTSGGMALPFYASVRIKVFIKQGSRIKQGGDDSPIIGHRANIDVVKNRVGPPFGKGEFVIFYASGFDRVSDVCAVAREEGIISAAGAWMSYISPGFKNADGENLFKAQGIGTFIEGMRGRPDVVSEIREMVVQKIKADMEAIRQSSGSEVAVTAFTEQQQQLDQPEPIEPDEQ